MSRGAWQRLGSRKPTDGRPWSPPGGWIETSRGIWVPPDYKPLAWELQPPTIVTLEDERREYVRCSQSAPYAIFHYFWSVDVDTDPEQPVFRRIPALPHLRRFLRAWQRPKNIHVEKTRQMLVSWACMALFLWDILFQDDWQNLVVSKKALDVDDGGAQSTYNSLLGKVRMIYEHLPPFLYMPLDIVKYRIHNETRKSGIRGETGNRDAGRSGAFKRALLDEAARIPASESSFKAARQACKNGLGLVSTPEGKGNVFARIRFTPVTTFEKLSFHWTENPLKNAGLRCEHCTWVAHPGTGLDPREQFLAHVCPHPEGKRATNNWYRRESMDLRPDQIASELDINYEQSVRGRVFPTFNSARHVREMSTYRPHSLIGVNQWGAPLGPRFDLEHVDSYRERYLRCALDPLLPIFTCWDFGVGDPTSILLAQELSPDGPLIRFVDEIELADKSYDFFHTFWRDLWLRLWIDLGGNAIHSFQHYGDPAGKNRESDLKSWIQNLANANPPIMIQHLVPQDMKQRALQGSLLDWLDFIRAQYAKDRIEISSWCSHLIDATSQYHFPVDEEGNPLPGQHEPVHDQWSHACAAKRYMYKYRYLHLLQSRTGGNTASDVLMMGRNTKPKAQVEF
jgi:hypothetical protein